MYIFIVRSKSERERGERRRGNGAEDPGCSTESAEAKASGRAGASDFDIEQTPLLCGHPPLVAWPTEEPDCLLGSTYAAAPWIRDVDTVRTGGSPTEGSSRPEWFQVNKEEQLLYRWKSTA